jgi:hypothetical protein
MKHGRFALINPVEESRKSLMRCCLAVDAMNFPLAGNRLSNIVIPAWETPAVLTRGFLESRQVDFVVQIAKNRQSPAAASAPPVAGLDLYYSANIPYDEGFAAWSVWSTGHTRSNDREIPRQTP